jgi:YbbR domain-containing protein
MADKRKRDGSEKERTITIILSILVALVLWAYVLGEVNPTTQQTIANVPVQLLNIQSLTARELAIAGNGKYTVNVIIEGKRSDIMNITAQDIIAEADLFGWSKGENYIPVNVIAPESLKVLEAKPAKVEVTIEDLVALSKPIEVIFRGNMPADTEEGAIEVKPAAIEITGARSEVEAVTSVQVTVDVADFSADGATVQVVATAVNYADMPVENIKLSATYIQVFAKLLRVKEVPFDVSIIGQLAEGLGAELSVPETIKIKGDRTVIEGITSISAEPVDVTGVTGNGTVSVRVILPEGVELAKGYESIQAGVTIEETSTKVFQYSADEIVLEGLTTGKSVNMQLTIVEVSVSGRKDIVNQLQKEDLNLFIDTEDLEAGVQNVKIQVAHEAALHTVTILPEEVTIELIKAE